MGLYKWKEVTGEQAKIQVCSIEIQKYSYAHAKNTLEARNNNFRAKRISSLRQDFVYNRTV